jgi:hypothetical protein
MTNSSLKLPDAVEKRDGQHVIHTALQRMVIKTALGSSTSLRLCLQDPETAHQQQSSYTGHSQTQRNWHRANSNGLIYDFHQLIVAGSLEHTSSRKICL